MRQALNGVEKFKARRSLFDKDLLGNIQIEAILVVGGIDEYQSYH
jgi:hypothetical protein